MNVSVIIPVYNAEKYIEQAVSSAVKLDEVKEVILIEDNSPDDALKVCEMLQNKYKKVKLYRHEGGINLGAGVSRNLGIKNASQEYISFLDADDYYLPNRFSRDKEIFVQDSTVDGVYNAIGVDFYSTKAKDDYTLRFGNRNLTTMFKEIDPQLLFEYLWSIGKKQCGHFHLNGFTIKKSSLKKLSYYFEPSLKVHQDTEFMNRASFYLKLVAGDLMNPVAVRGVHEENRITDVIMNERKLNQNQYYLYDVVLSWAKKNDIHRKYQQFFFKKKLYFQLELLDKNRLKEFTCQRNKNKWFFKTINTRADILVYRPLFKQLFWRKTVSYLSKFYK